jgi:hypothetical protein
MSGVAAYAELERAFAADAADPGSSGLSDERREELRRFWLGRASGELTTALSFEFMLEDLRDLAAPPALLELAETAIGDEHRHVDWCLRLARRLDEAQPANAELGGTRPLQLPGASESDNRILRTVFGGCFSETVAVQVLLTSQSRIAYETPRRLNRQHLAEEVRHARLGWGLLAWPELRRRDREMIGSFVPALTELAREAWCGPQRSLDSELEGFGYLSTPLVAQAFEIALREVILPGLERNQVPF